MNKRWIIALLVVVAMMAAACGDSSEDTTDEPLTTTTAAAAATTTTAAATTTEAATTTAVAFDLVAAVDAYLSTIPDGFLAVGDITAFKDAMESGGAYVIDVRETSEYDEGHIAGAINIPMRTLVDNLDKIPTDRQVFIYCKSGWRAAVTLASMGNLGYDNVLSYAPGWNGWTEAGEPVSTEVPAAETFTVPDIPLEMLVAVGDFMSTIPEGYLTAGDVEKVKDAMAAGAFMIDVRTPDEYALGYIGEAVNIPLRTIAQNLDMVPTDAQVIVYCKSGHRAGMAVSALQTLGYKNVKGFSGSYNAWVDAGEPVSTP